MYNSSSTHRAVVEQADTFTTCTVDGDDDDENHLLCGTAVWMCSNDNSCIVDAFCVHVRLTEAIGHQEMLQVNVPDCLHRLGLCSPMSGTNLWQMCIACRMPI